MKYFVYQTGDPFAFVFFPGFRLYLNAPSALSLKPCTTHSLSIRENIHWHFAGNYNGVSARSVNRMSDLSDGSYLLGY